MKKIRDIIVIGVVGLSGLCLLAIIVAALSNIGLPNQSSVVDRLSEVEKARLAEVYHLRQSLGEAAWPGWGEAEIPVIIYNEAYAFITGFPDPPPGWNKVPQNIARGGPWELVPDDDFQGEPYYRQRLPEGGETPESFVVLVGDRWVASMTTMEWMKIALREQIRQDLPPVLEQVFPYRVAGALLLDSSDWYISGLLHETFHAYQGMVAASRLAEAENAASSAAERYPWEDDALREAWQVELDLLVQAVRAGSDQEAANLARQFLAQRTQRRESGRLAAGQVAYERLREWLEGSAKYVEMEIWRQAATAPGYEPYPALSDDPDFKGYQTFDRRWSQEVAQIGRMANNRGDGRFYYTGLAQATLLDRFMPAWKSVVLEEGVYLEELLSEAVQKTN